MIDLHTHSVFSDGELIPAELARRAEHIGYRALAITDHVDHSNYDFIIPRIMRVCEELSRVVAIRVIPGVEITHVPPELIGELAEKSRTLGAAVIVVHGETIVEPVREGTNRAALLSPIDILAHPGLITEEEAVMAAERSILLEITTRKGHSLTNGHVLSMARRTGAKLIMNTDSHAPGDLVALEQARLIARGAGMDSGEAESMFENAEEYLRKVGFRGKK